MALLTAETFWERGWFAPTRRQFHVMASPEGAFLIGEPATFVAECSNASKGLVGILHVTFQMSTASLETEATKRSIELLGVGVATIRSPAGTDPPWCLVPAHV